jgi:hypothetical protein
MKLIFKRTNTCVTQWGKAARILRIRILWMQLLSFKLKPPGKIARNIQRKTGHRVVLTWWQVRRFWSLPGIKAWSGIDLTDWRHPGSKSKHKYETSGTVAIMSSDKACRINNKKSKRSTMVDRRRSDYGFSLSEDMNFNPEPHRISKWQ